MASIKHKRLESQIQRVLSEIISSELKTLTSEFVNVTAIELTSDLSFLTIYVHFMNASDAEKEAGIIDLEKKSGAIKQLLGKKVQLRKMPELIFELDGTLDEASKIEELLKLAREKDQKSNLGE